MSGRRPYQRTTLGHPGANGWQRLLALAEELHAEQARRDAGEQAAPGAEPAPALERRGKRRKRGRR